MVDQPQDLQALLRDLQLGDRTKKMEALRAIGTAAQGQLERVRPYLLTVISGDDPQLQYLGAWTLAELGENSDLIVEVLARYLDASGDEGNIIRYGAVEALSNVKGNPAVAELLMRTFQHDENIGVRLGSIWALGAVGDEAAREQLEYLAEQGEGEEQRAARAALELFGAASFQEIHSRSDELRGKEQKAGGGCLVASVIYGETSTEVTLLRLWRDLRLRSHLLGRLVIMVYGVASPTLAGAARKSSMVQGILRLALVVPAVRLAKRGTASR